MKYNNFLNRGLVASALGVLLTLSVISTEAVQASSNNFLDFRKESIYFLFSGQIQ